MWITFASIMTQSQRRLQQCLRFSSYTAGLLRGRYVSTTLGTALQAGKQQLWMAMKVQIYIWIPLWFRTKASISCRINTCALGLPGPTCLQFGGHSLARHVKITRTATNPSLLWIQRHVSKIFCTIMVPCILSHASPCCSNLFGPIPDTTARHRPAISISGKHLGHFAPRHART